MLTIEPGVYLPNILGIRLENVYVVTASSVPQYTLLHPTLINHRKFLRLDTLDYIPFQRKMIMDELLTPQEWEMLREYHKSCKNRIEQKCSTDLGRDWLRRESQNWLE